MENPIYFSVFSQDLFLLPRFFQKSGFFKEWLPLSGIRRAGKFAEPLVFPAGI